MQLDLQKRPLSRHLSRHFLFLETDACCKGRKKGLFLGLSAEGAGTFGRLMDIPPGFIQLLPDGKEGPDAFRVEAEESFAKVDCPEGGTLCIALHGEKSLLISGRDCTLTMKVRLNMGESILETPRGYEVIMGSERYVISPKKGKGSLEVAWELENLKSSDPVLTFVPEGGALELVMMDTDTNYEVPEPPATAADAAAITKADFASWLDKLVYKEDPEAAYDLWIGFQYRNGQVLTDVDRTAHHYAKAMEQPFAALAFKDINCRIGLLNALMATEEKSGMIPKEIYLRDLVPEAAPPVCGLALADCDCAAADKDLLEKFYCLFSKAVNWWFVNRYTKAGCFYAYIHETGGPGKPVLPVGRPCVSPDLAAYLILDCQVLEKAGACLGREDVSLWKERREEMEKVLCGLWTENGFVSKDAMTEDTAPTPSPLALIPVILGDEEKFPFISALKEKAAGLDAARTDYLYAEMLALKVPALAAKIIENGVEKTNADSAAAFSPACAGALLALKGKEC